MYYVKSKHLKKFKHGFFSRLNGVSTGSYTSLNCGYSSLDKRDNIDRNRKIISETLGFNADSLIVPNQYHSNKILITDNLSNKFKCDGLINFYSNIALGVLTADCCPILVADKKNIFTGCMHVGWKGLYNQIIENFILEIEKMNLKKENIIFAIGPCISKKSYQVSEDFRENFISKEQQSINYFYFNKSNNNLYFNIKGLIKKKLNLLGFKNIWTSKLDTYTNNDRFFSYRYSCHNNIKDYGRMLSVIVKK